MRFRHVLGACALVLFILGDVFKVDGHYNTLVLVGGGMIMFPVALAIRAIGRWMGLWM
jgi:hypothetical protein